MELYIFEVELYDRVYYAGIGEFWDEVYYIITSSSEAEALDQALEWWGERMPNYELDDNVNELELDNAIDEWWASRMPEYTIRCIKETHK